MSELLELTEAESVAVVDVSRHSWWKSRDNTRLMIVVGIYHAKNETTGNYEASSYDVLEVGETTPLHLTVKIFKEQIQRGHLVWVRRPPDAPAPPDLIKGVERL